ncbi:hypothetical protein DPMN_181920 [Dreissena polymorpha]|uniref:Uncharacterized protein n=1 Tax=Dreissena polymorpha TaxID=45954 RepID=A0A9D4DEX5_DREPO|nr:hypothetical protein DPMN_181920 [Dreissena polymorpha]
MDMTVPHPHGSRSRTIRGIFKRQQSFKGHHPGNNTVFTQTKPYQHGQSQQQDVVNTVPTQSRYYWDKSSDQVL